MSENRDLSAALIKIIRKTKNTEIQAVDLPKFYIDAKEVREGMNLTQREFSEAFGIPLKTLQKWEQGIRSPNRSGALLLMMIRDIPTVVNQFLQLASDDLNEG